MKKMWRPCTSNIVSVVNGHPIRDGGVAEFSLAAAQEQLAWRKEKFGGEWWIERLVKVNFGVGERWVKA